MASCIRPEHDNSKGITILQAAQRLLQDRLAFGFTYHSYHSGACVLRVPHSSTQVSQLLLDVAMLKVRLQCKQQPICLTACLIMAACAHSSAGGKVPRLGQGNSELLKVSAVSRHQVV